MWSAASTSGSAPSARSASLVTGPIETIRGPSRVPAAAWKKRTRRGARERRVVGAQRGRAGLVAERLGDRAVEREDVDLARRARAARRAARRARPAARAISARVHRDLAQRLDERLGDGALGHDVGLDAVRAQRARRPGPDRGDRRAGQRAGVVHAREQLVDAVRARDADQVVAGRAAGTIDVERLDADRRRLDDRAPSARRRAASALAWARARVTATLHAAQRARRRRARRARAPSAATSPTIVIAGALHAAPRGDLRDRRERAGDHALVGERAALDDRDRLVGRVARRRSAARRCRASWRTPM